MNRFSIIAVSLLVFGLIGPAIGSMVVAGSRGGDLSQRVFMVSYVFGIGPALLAGATYGMLRLRATDVAPPWYRRAAMGAGAGFFGCLVFVVFGATYTLVTAGTSTFRGELDFYGLTFLAGVPAGAICALLMRGWLRSRTIPRP